MTVGKSGTGTWGWGRGMRERVRTRGDVRSGTRGREIGNTGM